MFKRLFCILIYLLPSLAMTKVEMRWLSVAAVLLDDGRTKILFDPAFTRPGLLHWLNISPFRSDEKLVGEVFRKQGITKLDAVFVSHSHFDHSVDAPIAAKLGQAILYVDESTERIAKAYNDELIMTRRLGNRVSVRVGEFIITPIKRKHSDILGLFEFLPGPVPENFKFDFFDYRVGDTWFYVIRHPEGDIIIDQGSESFVREVEPLLSKADVLIQGVANRNSDEVIYEGYLKVFKPKLFIPNHFDNFFYGFNPEKEELLPGINLDKFLKNLNRHHPDVKVVKPSFGNRIVLLEKGEPKPPLLKSKR